MNSSNNKAFGETAFPQRSIVEVLVVFLVVLKKRIRSTFPESPNGTSCYYPHSPTTMIVLLVKSFQVLSMR